MNIRNKITIKPVSYDNAKLPSVILRAIGNPSPAKILKVIENYQSSDHAIIGAFIDDRLIGILGFYKTSKVITIRHISVLIEYQRKGVGTLLVQEIKNCYEGFNIFAETDAAALDFYIKSGFKCHAFKGPYGNLRYKCEF